MSLRLDIDNACAAYMPDNAALKRWVVAALATRRANAELSLRIVDDAEMRELNHRYRGADYATNVLSFPAELPPELKLPHLGDIVICAAVVEREAQEQHKSRDAHWAHMIVHGTLHLLGYDHVEDTDADIMEALEIAILRELNFANPYLATPHAEDDVVNHV